MAVTDLLTSAAKGLVGALPSFMFAAGLGEQQINKLTAMALNKILFAQGWMFAVEVEGIGGMGIDFFMKDITWGTYTIETEPKRIGANEYNQPVSRTAQPISMVVRDTNAGLIYNAFKVCLGRVINDDGTINLQNEYLMNIRIYRLQATGVPTLMETLSVIPTQCGEMTFSKDQISEFISFPLSFVQRKTFGDFAATFLPAV
ncbi:phage tail protein [Pseudocitrobacter sp. RIT415]|uniref:phage tail protein n=1 Tax=Pseudocitrobacter sp. RIT415 TaxID=2202163 RepID=UPI000D37D500|nr:phage tail protein [Pseudocitrobacter sp. RIT 415]RAU45281.1 phage tail protein [Pseudocitrobacter sp. RIT 415]